ncbi:septation ring formation regulator EzrA [Salibacterium halotolerans]|uniref:Septation ring formation regulator n=1 Tax=Salibacterium halotolerans TaxID=1884432 RepID=A0A1I5VIP2_9BACI|nr:septation ring formation regulator EzrA [Salibacterium halotolerans]SFQ07385.1 septation ring formation regulator [Salibacterium halotolerans]
MVYYVIIAAVLVTAAVIIYGAVSRRSIYKSVDRLEKWKSEISNKPVADEIAKVKDLKMSGETEEKFEEWRKEWDDILGRHLPDIEEALFDIEERANRYRFGKARVLIEGVDNQLQDMDAHIQKIFREVEQLIHSEEENRSGITENREMFGKLQGHLAENRLSLGSTAPVFERKLKEMEAAFTEFQEERDAGNYTKANQILSRVHTELKQEELNMSTVPGLLVDIETDICAECTELENGVQEMEQEGYILSHYDIRDKVKSIREELPELKKAVENLELERVQERLDEIRTFIEETYDSLEKEVEARRFVEENAPETREELTRLEEQASSLGEERRKVERSYRIPEDEQKRQEKVETSIQEALKEWRVFQDVQENQKQPFTGLKKNLEQLKKDIAGIDQSIRRSKEKLHTLRKDELKALETLRTLRRQLLRDRMTLERSYLPKVPSSLLNEMDAAGERLNAAASNLEESPVEMGRVNASVEDAEHYVQKVHQQLHATIDQAHLAERAIQLGNRHRSSSEVIHNALIEAESLFKKGYYDEAVNAAVQAVERKEPNAMQKLEMH